MDDVPQRTPVADAPISVVLPAFNAAAHLAEVLAGWRAVLGARGGDHELLVVDDGSGDGTAAEVERLAADLPQLRLLKHDARRGFGAALRTALAEVRHPLVCHCPCDRQYDPADLARLLGDIDHVDFVVGCRAWRQPPAWRRALGFVYRGAVLVLFGIELEKSPCWLGWAGYPRRFLARWVYGVNAHDPECAFRLFRRAVFDDLPIQSDGTFALVEVLAKANFLGAVHSQQPVAYRPPDGPGRDVMGLARPDRAECWRVLNRPTFGPPPREEVAVAAAVDEPPTPADDPRANPPADTGVS